MKTSASGLSARRIVIIGGPKAGKSTLARQLRADGYPTYCGDPRSAVRGPEPDVTYLPEGLSFSAASAYVATYWLTKPGPWVLEGQVMARALRKHLRCSESAPADRVLVLPAPHPAAYLTPAQEAMGKAVATVWDEIAPHFAELTEYVTVADEPADVSPWSPLDAIDDLVRQIALDDLRSPGR